MAELRSMLLDAEEAVRYRYSKAAVAVEQSLWCATTYDSKLLAAIPQQVLERYYGRGDPTRYLRPGESVLDLGSGAGKVCFIASRWSGPPGVSGRGYQ